MDQLPPLGRIIPQVVGPTYGIYNPILEKNADAIKSTAKETHSYGANPRQQLDVYTSSSKTDPKSTPILVFLYGGGFANGDKVMERLPGGLVYTNLGHFFADKLGFETIIMDYRLISHGAKFPSGGEDLDAVLQWVEKRYKGTDREVYVMGNSAGGIHLCTWLFDEPFKTTRRRLIEGARGVKLAGVLPLSTAFNFRHSSAGLRDAMSKYLGEAVDENAPMGCLQKCKESGEMQDKWPRILVLDCELDQPDIIESGSDFMDELKKVGGFDIQYQSLKGHNHISPPLGLGTGIEAEERWGYEVGEWVKSSS